MGLTFRTFDDLTACAYFTTPLGASEYYLTIGSPSCESFTEELDQLAERYHRAIDELGLGDDTLVFSRLYLSDIANEKDQLRDHTLFSELRTGAVSTIQQSPVSGGAVSLLAYHVRVNGTKAFPKAGTTFSSDGRRNGIHIHGAHYDYLWIANFCGVGPFDSDDQTTELFESFDGILKDHDMTLVGNAIRTWVYVRDVDNHYQGMVAARKRFFQAQGLTAQTRYIASTGIEGFSKEVNSLVALDACAVGGIVPSQIVRMEAPDHMSPTIAYGVTFERGTRLRFGDRSHLYISGTASIDTTGAILHIGDPRAQTRRAIENIRALLTPQGATLSDMAYIIVYVRNSKDAAKVREVLDSEIPANIPLLLLEGAVCRPKWLVELEGVAVIPDDAEYPPFL